MPTKPTIVSGARKKEPPARLLPSLVQPAPLTLLCMCCRTVRCATADGIVLWHPDDLEPAYDCAGAGAPGLDTFASWCVKAEAYRRAHRRLRTGQAWFTFLAQCRLDLPELIAKTEMDPFHDDDRMPAFLEFVEGNW